MPLAMTAIEPALEAPLSATSADDTGRSRRDADSPGAGRAGATQRVEPAEWRGRRRGLIAEGDQVQPGQALLRLDRTCAEATVAQAAIDQAQANLDKLRAGAPKGDLQAAGAAAALEHDRRSGDSS